MQVRTTAQETTADKLQKNEGDKKLHHGWADLIFFQDDNFTVSLEQLLPTLLQISGQSKLPPGVVCRIGMVLEVVEFAVFVG